MGSVKTLLMLEPKIRFYLVSQAPIEMPKQREDCRQGQVCPTSLTSTTYRNTFRIRNFSNQTCSYALIPATHACTGYTDSITTYF